MEKLLCKKFEELLPIELYNILKLRSEVFVVEQNCVYQDMDDKDILAHHVMFYDQDELAATTRLLAPGISYDNYSSIGRVCSQPKLRSKGFGRKIMSESIHIIENLYPGFDIKISAQSYLQKFYFDFGFLRLGEEYLEDNIPHVAMIRKRK